MDTDQRPKRQIKISEKMKIYTQQKKETEAKGQSMASYTELEENKSKSEIKLKTDAALNQTEEVFSETYTKWKEGMNILRTQLKSELTDEHLTRVIDVAEELNKCVLDAYNGLKGPVNQVIRRQMDSCSANTNNIIELAQIRMSENGMQPWDEKAERARLRMMLDKDYAASVYSSQSRSCASNQSSTSISKESISSKRADAVAKLAAKEVELEMNKKKALLETQLHELETEKEIRVAKAVISAYDHELKPEQHSEKVTQNQVLANNVASLGHALQESLDYNNLPVREPSTFSGDPIQYIKWKRSFESLIGTKRVKVSDKLALLEKYVAGEAAECIAGMFYRSDEEAFEEAWKMLDERFGHSSVTLSAFRNKLSSWPEIGTSDYLQLRRFADFLVTIDGASSHLPGLKILNDPEENQKLLRKLPDCLISKWCSIVVNHDNEGLDYPSFHKFTEFLSTQAKIATRPVCSLQALKGNSIKERHTVQITNKPNATVMTTNTLSNQPHASISSQQLAGNVNRTKTCVFCNAKDHFLPNCCEFMRNALDTRRSFIKDQRRCFKCLRTGHSSKDCEHPHTCGTCQRKHPTCLHDENFKYVQKTTYNTVQATTHKATNDKTSSSTSIMLPVWLSSKQNPQKEKLVYALIDSQSDTTFLDHTTIQELNPMSRQTTRLKIETIQEGKQPDLICERVGDLRVRGYNKNTFIDLPSAFTIDHIPLKQDTIPTRDTVKNWSHLQSIAKELPPLLDCAPGILIGFNCSQAFIPRECIVGGDSEPFAVRTDLGWGIIGPTSPMPPPSPDGRYSMCNRIIAKECPIISPNDVCTILEKDFQNDMNDGKTSQEDIKFIQIIENSITKDNEGHLEMPLPFKQIPNLPNNYSLAVKRLEHLKKRLQKDKSYYDKYCNFMNAILEKGECEEANTANEGKEWYIPHHGVFHPKKEKLRVVFDCSAKFQNTSLNDHLLAGPNLINNLIGVFCRFRKYPIAITCDVEKMFHQFRVMEEHRDFLRFLWWKDGDLSQEPTIYRMKVHLFGATSSPGCANYGLKYLAKENAELYPEASKFVQDDFYVDDGLSSLPTEEKTVKLIQETVELCTKGGLRLHKFASNSRKVMESIPVSERIENMQTLNLNFENIPIETTLGMQWSVENDTLHFRFSPPDRPSTRRGILAVVASVYDPLGLIAPFTLSGKRILQDICHKGTKWDEPVTTEILTPWKIWLEDLQSLVQLSIPRCYCPPNFGTLTNIQLHHFCDASFKGYGMCSYLRMKNDRGDVHCSLTIAKSRVSPKRVISIPRLELTAALVAAEVGSTIKRLLKFNIDDEFFWTDSQVVLAYIHNEAKKFHVFVANRVQKIRDLTNPNQWHHVSTDVNPADHASRGLRGPELLQSKWFSGPDFLWNKELKLPTSSVPDLEPKDPEIRISLKTQAVHPTFDLNTRLSHISNWLVATRVVARIMKLNSVVTNKDTSNLSLVELQIAKDLIIKRTQAQFFAAEMNCLSMGNTLPKTSSLCHAEPFLQNGILRVGGRLKNGSFSFSTKHPIILPKDCHITRLIIAHCHSKIKHQGRGMTLNEIRSQGFWIMSGSSQVAKAIHQCVMCRKLRGSPQEQYMASLPIERTEPSPPFTNVGMDCFGPVLVKNGRKEVKRYGLLFTCLSSRSVHLEMLDDLSTDAFINGLRCFVSIRGPLHKIYCDQGTNFVGADNELKAAMKEVNIDKLEQHFRDQCQFIFNTPDASHAGGVWERQVKTVKSVLNAITALCPGRLDDSSLRTLLYESMAIVNSRPITAIHQGDPTSPEPLTPNHILTMKPSVLLPPPGTFMKEDVYIQKRWRRVQYLAEQFWSRWRKEYVTAIAQRQKWLHPKRNLQVGDIVLVVDQNQSRNQWQLGRVILAPQDDDGLVRHVSVSVGTKNLNKKGQRQGNMSTLDRPIQKLVLVLEKE